jgi:ribonuclease D
LKNHIDVQKVFKGTFPIDKLSGLSHIALTITGKEISKYEQISNWNLRPLRKAQLHYAAMDVAILILVYDGLNAVLMKEVNVKDLKLIY